MNEIITIERESPAGHVLAAAFARESTYKVALLWDGGLKVKVNEDMWTLPLTTTQEARA